MKHLRLVLAAAVCSSLLSAALALACDKSKTTAAATTAATTATKDAACTAEMVAACKSAKATTVSAANGCCAAKSSATTASRATTAPVGKVNALAVDYAPGTSAAQKVGATSAGSSCSAHKTISASAAGSSCSSHKSSATTASKGACSDHKNTALSSTCNGHGLVMGGGGKVAAHDCDACADLSLCEEEIQANGAAVQVVPIKNGVMYVYTADSPSRVQGVQAAMAHRNEHVSAILASGDRALLCPECKSMRGAIASGKLTRETVNIEGGCMTLVTSKDPAMVTKLHAMAGFKGAKTVKS
jgi:hypothetical protein